MAIPSGSGTEVLSSTYVHAQSNDPTAFRWDGTPATTGVETYTVPANHIITVLSIVAIEMGDAAEVLHLYTNDGSNDIYLLYDQPIGARSTFIWNDKFVLKAGHKLIVTSAVANIDWYISYIDQDWT